MIRRSFLPLLLWLLLPATAAWAQTLQSFHLWSIAEVYSNYDGRVQYVELVCQPADFENLFAGQTLVASQGGNTNTFTFPSNLPTNTSNKRCLIATFGFTRIPGMPTPDYVLPDNFLFLANGTVNFASSTSIATYTSFPANPAQSLQYPGGATGTASPTNFAGATASIVADTAVTNPFTDVPDGTITVETTTIATGLAAPLGVVEPDDNSGRLFIYDQAGRVIVVKNGTPLATPMLNVSANLVSLGNGDERGLIGFATHPNFATNPKIYTYTSEPSSGAAHFTNTAASQNHQSVISEYTLQGNSASSDIADTATRRIILRIDQPQSNHNGGTLRFGPDGFLYIALGDGGAGNDSGNGHSAGGNGQDINNVYGKILRIDVDQVSGAPGVSGQYTIPPTNPFVGVAGLDEIFVYGLRNPYAFSFDSGNFTPGNFRLYIGDVGQGRIEEMDLVTPANIGANFGWPRKEGSYAFRQSGGTISSVPATPPAGVLEDPIAEYDHGDGIAVVCGFVYRGTQLPDLAGKMVFGDYTRSGASPGGRLFFLDTGDEVKELILGSPERALGLYLKGFGQSRSGEIFICGSTSTAPSGTTGVVMRLRSLTSVTGAESWMFYE